MRQSARPSIGCSLTRTIQYEQLMFQQNGFCNDGTYTTGPGKSDNRHNDVKEKDDEVAHSRIVTDATIVVFRDELRIRHGHECGRDAL